MPLHRFCLKSGNEAERRKRWMIRLRLTQPRFSLRSLRRLMTKYRNVPMDFPDATLIRAAEQTETDQILTLDRRVFSSFRFAGPRRFKLLLDSN